MRSIKSEFVQTHLPCGEGSDWEIHGSPHGVTATILPAAGSLRGYLLESFEKDFSRTPSELGSLRLSTGYYPFRHSLSVSSLAILMGRIRHVKRPMPIIVHETRARRWNNNSLLSFSSFVEDVLGEENLFCSSTAIILISGEREKWATRTVRKTRGAVYFETFVVSNYLYEKKKYVLIYLCTQSMPTYSFF